MPLNRNDAAKRPDGRFDDDMAGACEALQRALIAAAERLQMSDAEADRLERELDPRSTLAAFPTIVHASRFHGEGPGKGV